MNLYQEKLRIKELYDDDSDKWNKTKNILEDLFVITNCQRQLCKEFLKLNEVHLNNHTEALDCEGKNGMYR